MMGRKEKEKKLFKSEQRLELNIGTIWKMSHGKCWHWRHPELVGSGGSTFGVLNKAGGAARGQRKVFWGFLAAFSLGAIEGPCGDSGSERGTGFRPGSKPGSSPGCSNP